MSPTDSIPRDHIVALRSTIDVCIKHAEDRKARMLALPQRDAQHEAVLNDWKGYQRAMVAVRDSLDLMLYPKLKHKDPELRASTSETNNT